MSDERELQSRGVHAELLDDLEPFDCLHQILRTGF
jgi:hypothetical protein